MRSVGGDFEGEINRFGCCEWNQLEWRIGSAGAGGLSGHRRSVDEATKRKDRILVPGPRVMDPGVEGTSVWAEASPQMMLRRCAGVAIDGGRISCVGSTKRVQSDQCIRIYGPLGVLPGIYSTLSYIALLKLTTLTAAIADESAGQTGRPRVITSTTGAFPVTAGTAGAFFWSSADLPMIPAGHRSSADLPALVITSSNCRCWSGRACTVVLE